MNLKSMFAKRINKDRIYDNVTRKRVNYLFLVPSTLVVVLSVMLVLNKNTSDVVYKYESDIIVINELSDNAKLNYTAYDVGYNRENLETLNVKATPMPNDYVLEHNYELSDMVNNEKFANQVIFKNGEKIIDIYYTSNLNSNGRPRCIAVPKEEMKSSIIAEHDVKILEYFSDSYSVPAMMVRFTYNDIFYDIEFVNLDVEEIVSYLRTILK